MILCNNDDSDFRPILGGVSKSFSVLSVSSVVESLSKRKVK